MERFSRYILRRLLVLAVGILVILTVEFLLFRVVPDDPLQWALPHSTDVPSSPLGEWAEEVTEMLGQPLYVQYFVFIGDMLTGDFGYSYGAHRDISDFIYSAMWRTMLLLGASLSFCLVTGSLAGRAISKAESHLARQASSIAALALFSVPVLAWQWFFLRYFYIEWGLLPAGGGPSDIDLEHTIMPLASMILASVGVFILCARDGQTRASAATNQDRATLRDGLFAAMPNLQFMVAASVVSVVSIELTFIHGGLGWYFVSSLFTADYFMLQATFFLLAAMVLVANFALETVVTLVRPKRRLDLCLREDDDHSSDAGAQFGSPPISFARIGGALARVARDYLRSPVGVVSLVVFTAIAVLAAVGPSFTSDQVGSRFDKSSTDLFLDGGAALVAISVAAGTFALVIGVAFGIAIVLSRPRFDIVLVAIAQGLIAIPFLAILVLRLALMRYGFSYLEAALVLSVPVAALVALLSFHGLVSSRRLVAAASQGASKITRLAHSLPSATVWALGGLKYGAPITAFTVFVCDSYGLMGYDSWGSAFVEGWRQSVLADQWDLLLPPIIGTALLVGSMFLVLDTLERVIRTRFSWLV